MGELKHKNETVNDRIWLLGFTARATEDVVRMLIYSQETDPETKEVIIAHTDTVEMRVDDPIFVHAWVAAGGEAANIMPMLEMLKATAYNARAAKRAERGNNDQA